MKYLIIFFICVTVSAKDRVLENILPYKQVGSTCVGSVFAMTAKQQGKYKHDVRELVERYYRENKGAYLSKAHKWFESSYDLQTIKFKKLKHSTTFWRAIKIKKPTVSYYKWLSSLTPQQAKEMAEKITKNNPRYKAVRKLVFRSIDKGKPVIIGRRVYRGHKSFGHATLITGYNDKDDLLYISDSWGTKHINKAIDMKYLIFTIHDLYSVK